MKKPIIVLAAVILILQFADNSARADNVGAVIGAGVGFFVAGPVGLIGGVIIGGIFGKPWWGPDQSATKCWIDTNFHRHCPQFPLN